MCAHTSMENLAFKNERKCGMFVFLNLSYFVSYNFQLHLFSKKQHFILIYNETKLHCVFISHHLYILVGTKADSIALLLWIVLKIKSMDVQVSMVYINLEALYQKVVIARSCDGYTFLLFGGKPSLCFPKWLDYITFLPSSTSSKAFVFVSFIKILINSFSNY